MDIFLFFCRFISQDRASLAALAFPIVSSLPSTTLQGKREERSAIQYRRSYLWQFPRPPKPTSKQVVLYTKGQSRLKEEEMTWKGSGRLQVSTRYSIQIRLGLRNTKSKTERAVLHTYGQSWIVVVFGGGRGRTKRVLAADHVSKICGRFGEEQAGLVAWLLG
jgi:hypothetical protein